MSTEDGPVVLNGSPGVKTPLYRRRARIATAFPQISSAGKRVRYGPSSGLGTTSPTIRRRKNGHFEPIAPRVRRCVSVFATASRFFDEETPYKVEVGNGPGGPRSNQRGGEWRRSGSPGRWSRSQSVPRHRRHPPATGRFGVPRARWSRSGGCNRPARQDPGAPW